jgi:hypothetical protein
VKEESAIVSAKVDRIQEKLLDLGLMRVALKSDVRGLNAFQIMDI